MSDALGQDQFQPVNRRAGYGDALEMALSAARKGWTLSAGQGALIVEHYEEKLAAVIGERERFMHRMYEARTVTDAMVERASVALCARYGDYIAAAVEDNDIRAMLTAAITQEDA